MPLNSPTEHIPVFEYRVTRDKGDPLRSYASVRLCGDAGPYHLESLIPHPNPVVTYSGQTKENLWLTRKSVKILPVPVPRPRETDSAALTVKP